jgi:hypothetical protein
MPGRSSKTVALSLRLPVAVYQALAEDARCSGVTPSSFVRALLEARVASRGAESDLERLHALAAELRFVLERPTPARSLDSPAACELAKDVDQALRIAIDELEAFDLDGGAS